MPVWLSVDDYGRDKKAHAEQEEWLRLVRAAKALKLPSGTVQVYLIQPDGSIITTMHVAQAMKPDTLLDLLQKTIDHEHLRPRAPEAIQATVAKTTDQPKRLIENSLLFRIGARHVGPRSEWGWAENWVELKPEEWASLVPPATTQPGDSWRLKKALSVHLARFCFPPLPNFDPKNGEVTQATFTGTVTSSNKLSIDFSLRAQVTLQHGLGGIDADGSSTAQLVGRARYDRAKKAITDLHMVSTDAQYLWHWEGKPLPTTFAVVLEVVP